MKRARTALILACGFLLTLVSVLLSLYQPTFLAHLEARFFDSQIPNDPPPPAYVPPIVVAVDDESLSRIGRWPWPRSVVARLLRAIAAQGPASVGIDALFAEPEAAPDFGKGPGTPSHPSVGDRDLAGALCSAPFVLGYEFTFSGGNPAKGWLLHPLQAIVLQQKGAPDPKERFWHPSGVISNLPEFTRCVSQSGFVNAGMDNDGNLRRMPVVMAHDDKLYPSLALATVLRAQARRDAQLHSTWSGARDLQIGSQRIPLDERGRLLVRYRQSYADIKPLSAAALLEGRLPPDALRGRIVFLGATATGMGEAVATPLAGMLNGVQIHAIVADNIVRGDFARQSPWWYRVVAVLALGAAATLACLGRSALRPALLLSLMVVAAWQGAGWLFRSHGLLLSPVFPALVVAANFTLLTLLRSFYLERGTQRHERDLTRARDLIMTSLAALTEIRDTETGSHVLRCQRYFYILCQELSRYPCFRTVLDRETIELVSKLAPLHDIGKVGLPDQLLRKAGGFTVEEYEQVKQHTRYGRDAIVKAASRVGVEGDEMVEYAKDMTYAHHERWDGSGYPEGLAGEAIPWAGRVMAVVDCYDAMVTQRVYNIPVSHEEAVRLIAEMKGRHFDPVVVEAFLVVEGQWQEVARELAEERSRP